MRERRCNIRRLISDGVVPESKSHKRMSTFQIVEVNIANDPTRRRDRNVVARSTTCCEVGAVLSKNAINFHFYEKIKKSKLTNPSFFCL